MKTPLRRRIAAAALVLAAPLAAACGFNAQTDQQYQPAAGVNNHSGTVDILNAVLVSGTDGKGTLAVTLLNSSDKTDALVSVTGSDVTAAQLHVDLPAHQPQNLAEDGQIALTGAPIKAGAWVRLTLGFQNGQSTSVNVPVVPAKGDFADVPLPQAQATEAPQTTN